MSENGVVVVVAWCTCEVSTTMTSGFYQTECKGNVTKVSEDRRTVLEIDGKPAGEVYDGWTEGALTKGLEYDAEGTGNVLAASSFMPLGEPIGSTTDGYVRVLHPAFLSKESGALTNFADSYEGMELRMLSGSAETLGKKISDSAKSMLQDEMGQGEVDADGKVKFTIENCVGAFMIFW